jgi:hypothetical protein
MLQRSSVWVVAFAAFAGACGGSSANTSPAASEPEAAPAESAAVTPAETAADPATNEAVPAATSAAEAWLKLVDEQQYDESWKNAAGVFRGAVSTEDWSKAVGGVRGQVGQLVSRKLASANYTTSLPGVRDGKYVVIQFETSFANKASAVETVTPMLDDDGSWRVAGYFVK